MTAPAASPSSLELDLAFCCDCTGSMGAYIRSAQENIRAIATAIHERTAGRASVRYALVKYRDHPPQDSTFATETHNFTPSLELIKKAVDTMVASGGGDGPEAVAAALHELHELSWRPNASKVAVLIADAPPHGLGESGDGFPQGCPLGHDPVQICKQLAAKGVIVYAVGVEPILSTSYKFARDFMMAVAKATEGKFLPLGKASILSDVIVNGAVEGLQLDELWARMQADIVSEAERNNVVLSNDALVAAVEEKLAMNRAAAPVAQVVVDNPYEANYDDANVERLLACGNMKEARLDTQLNAHAAKAAGSYNWQAQSSRCEVAELTEEQCHRRGGMAKKAAGMHKW